jgi:hypothetical protein
MVQGIGRPLRKLERCAPPAEAEGLLVIVRSYLNLHDPKADAAIAALQAAGFLRRGIRMVTIRENGHIEGLTEPEQQFLAERRRTK